jgi:hypothetical protein
MGHKTPILGAFLCIRVWLGTPDTAHAHAYGYRLDGRMPMTSIKTEQQEVTAGTNITLGHTALIACDKLLHISVLEASSETISMSKHAVNQKRNRKTLRYICTRIHTKLPPTSYTCFIFIIHVITILLIYNNNNNINCYILYMFRPYILATFRELQV